MSIKQHLPKYWRNNKKKFENVCDMVETRPTGIWFTEGFLLCSVFDLLEVDLIVESGTAWGQSTEIMASYFDDLKKQIITIDSDGRFQQYKNTSTRLIKYKNVSCLKGNSFDIIPEILNKNKDKKIGIFIDGPKGERARSLGNKMFERDNVKCVGYHDMLVNKEKPPNLKGEMLDTRMLKFINQEYFYLNDKVVKNFKPSHKKTTFPAPPPHGPGLLIQIK